MGNNTDPFDAFAGDPLGEAGEHVTDFNARAKSKGWRRNFTRVPREWELRLLQARRIGAYRLGLELLYRHWRAGNEPIAVTCALAKTANLSRRSRWNAVAELERLGLIMVERSAHRAPRVTLLHVSEG